MKFGHGTASLLIARLHAGARQHSLARALHEYGRLVRTVFAVRYLTDTQLRRRVRRQLNKGKNLHALRRRLFFAHQGHVRRRRLNDQIDQALCLTLVTNAVVLWNTPSTSPTRSTTSAPPATASTTTPSRTCHLRRTPTSTPTAATPSTSTPSSPPDGGAPSASPALLNTHLRTAATGTPAGGAGSTARGAAGAGGAR
jgi:hypothetical protein